jgi:hypothetical protein
VGPSEEPPLSAHFLSDCSTSGRSVLNRLSSVAPGLTALTVILSFAKAMAKRLQGRLR